jgi:ketosteroid isomerase-like protein
MNEENNVKTVKDAYTAYQDGNMKALLGYLSEDVQWFEVGPQDVIPTAGTRKGRKQVEDFFDTLESNEEVESLRPQHFVAQANMVVVLGELRSRVRATGRLINSPWVHVFALRDGKISEFRSFYDTAAAMTAYSDTRSSAAKAGTSVTRRPALL